MMNKTLRSLLLAFACGTAFVSGLAFAQTIVRSVQQSQDPSGPIGFDANNNVFFQRGVHLLSTAPATPVLSACGTNPTILGTDFSGTVTMGTGTPTGCVITFSVAFGAIPNCVVNWQGTPLAAQNWTTTTTAITLVQTATSSNKVNYICPGTL